MLCFFTNKTNLQDEAKLKYVNIVEELLKAEGGEITEEVNESSDSKYNNLVVTRQDNYTKILLNRPTRKNAITVEVRKKYIYIFTHRK